MQRLVRGRLTTFFVVLAMMMSVVLVVTPRAEAVHGDACLDVTPETDTNMTGTTHTMTATLKTATPVPPSCGGADKTAGAGGVTVEFEVVGPRNAEAGSCDIPAGQSSCQFGYVDRQDGSDGTQATDTIRAWIDGHEDPTETPNESEPPEVLTEPDGADAVTKTWATPSSIDCDDQSGDDTETNPLTAPNNTETYTCTVQTGTGSTKTALGNASVYGENENGINDPDATDGASYASPDYSCTTGNDGTCQITVSPSESETGTAEICFWVSDTAGSPADGATVCGSEATDDTENDDRADQVEKTWQARAATSGGLDAEPEFDREATGTNTLVDVTVYDQFGDAFSGSTGVALEFFEGSAVDTDGNSPSSPDKTCTTSGSSTCSIQYTSNNPGKDRMCVWINSDPAMSGNRDNGTCDGESLSDGDDAANEFDAPSPPSDDVDVIEREWFTPAATTATRLDCEPESDTNPTGTGHTVTCTARDGQNNLIGGANIDAEATGTNDPDNGETFQTPDFSCVTTTQGTCSFTHGPGGQGQTNNAGNTVYRVWIDRDGEDQTITEIDQAETRTQVDNDGTDVVEKAWTANPASLTMTPDADTATVGECNPFTVTVRTSNNQPAQGAVIDVEQVHARASNGTNNDEPIVSFCTPTTGPNPSGVDTTKGDLSSPNENPDNAGTAGGETEKQTDGNGQVTFGIRVSAANGADGSGQVTVNAFFDQDEDDDPDSTEPRDSAIKTWETAASGGRTIDCVPETATTETDDQHVVSCTVLGSDGQPDSGISVTFTETGPGTFVSESQTSTNTAGQVSVTVGSAELGTQTITGTITNSTQNEPDTDECDRTANDPSGAPSGVCSDSVTNTWTEPEPEPEPAQCDDGLDNDNDGDADFPADEGCDSTTDDDESDDPPVDEKCPGYENAPGNHVVGTEGPDILVGTEGDDIICGLGGNDQIDGLGGNDVITGGSGNDTVDGGDGADDILAQDGDDTVSGNEGNDEIIGGPGDDELSGNGGKDVLLGGGGNDVLKGNAGNDFANGAGGNDRLNGGSGNDNLKGGKGNDAIKGGPGNDTINGGRGKDGCHGGGGKDTIKNCEGASSATRRRYF